MKAALPKYVLFPILALIFSCQKDDKTVSELIIGKWEWVKTIIPYGGQVSNPRTSGNSKTLEISSNGTMKEYKNDLLINTSNYIIEEDRSNPNNGYVFSSTIITSHFSFVNDTLIFNEAYVDGEVSYYSRKK